MSLESSQERTEQEWPRSATEAGTDHSSAAQRDSGREQFSAIGTPAPVPPDPDELVALLLSWIHTSDWSTSQTYLQAHSELLTEAAAQVLARLTQHQPDQHAQEILLLHQQLLQIAGKRGVEAAYQSLLHQEEKNDAAATEQEELQAQVIAWLQTPDWEISQTYLQSHPQLLTDAAEQMMEALKRSQRERQAKVMINLHQALLQKARIEGVEVAYKLFLVPESKTLLNDQEGATYQALQDPITLNDAGMAALRQYWANGQVVDLNRAVECWHEALNLIPSNSPHRPALLNNLGTGLRVRYARTGELADLESAIDVYQQAVQATPPDSPHRPWHLNNLGIGLQDRYSHTGELVDLKAAITVYQQAVQTASPDSPDRPVRLSNLGVGLSNRYSRSGNLADLEAAITAFQQAVQATPPESPTRPALLNNLGNGLRDLYSRSGNLTDLEAAIDAFQQAVQATPPDSPNWPALLNNLGNGLSNRYGRSGNLADLEAAITAHQQAIQATPPDSPNRPVRLNNLGAVLRDRYGRSGNLADLEAAIDAYQQAVQATLLNSPDRPGWLNNLGAVLRDRYWPERKPG